MNCYYNEYYLTAKVIGCVDSCTQDNLRYLWYLEHTKERSRQNHITIVAASEWRDRLGATIVTWNWVINIALLKQQTSLMRYSSMLPLSRCTVAVWAETNAPDPRIVLFTLQVCMFVTWKYCLTMHILALIVLSFSSIIQAVFTITERFIL